MKRINEEEKRDSGEREMEKAESDYVRLTSVVKDQKGKVRYWDQKKRRLGNLVVRNRQGWSRNARR